MSESLKRGDRLAGRDGGEAVFTGEFWVSARVFAHLEHTPGLQERLHRGFCTVCHRQWGDTSRHSRCLSCTVSMHLDGVKGMCPDNPAEGQRVITPFGEAVFGGYCWMDAGLFDYLQATPPNFKEEDGPFDPLCVSELGGCAGCGAYWGNSHKCALCVFCGSHVSLT